MLALLTLLAFVATFWFFGFRTDGHKSQFWVLYAIASGCALRWGIPFLWALAKPLAGVVLVVTVVWLVLSIRKRSSSAHS